MRVKQHDTPLLPHKPGRMSQVASTGLIILAVIELGIHCQSEITLDSLFYNCYSTNYAK
jgi:hypothetical protein